jgi:hypothetical protein
VSARAGTPKLLATLAADVGLRFEGVASKPAGDALKLRAPRIGLWDRYGGSMPSGWLRWIFEQYEFPFEVVYPQALDAGNLAGRFDVLVFVGGAIPSTDGSGGGEFVGRQPAAGQIPAEFHDRLGSVTVDNTVPKLREFLEAGGTVLTIGSSTSLAHHLGLPVANQLIERLPNGQTRPLPQERFYIPGALLEVAVDTAHPLAHGAPDRLVVFYDESPAFELRPDATTKGVRPIAWFDSPRPVRSGWAWGQHFLEGGAAVLEAAVGRGKLFLYGPEVTFRAQPHGTFKLVFNGIHYGTAASAPGAERPTDGWGR